MSTLFPHVVGHARAKSDLARCMQGGRLSGSFLFVGPQGVGRRRLALELAKASVCSGEGQVRPCNACKLCGRIDRGTCGDVIVLSKPLDKTKIPIAAVRKLLDEMALAPVECEQRTFIIDGAGDLMEETQNALLKALEEPPPQVLIVLIAEGEGEVLPTISSRCRILRLGELSPPEVERVLTHVGVAPDEIPPRARWSLGSPGRALADDALELAQVASAAVERMASGHARRDPMGTVDVIADYVKPGKGESRDQRSRVGRLAHLLQRVLRDALVSQSCPSAERLSGATLTELAALASLPEGRLGRALDVLNQVDADLSRNANVKLLLDGLALELGGALAPAAEVNHG